MGNYKSRPANCCADELRKKISEGYSVLRSRLSDDMRVREPVNQLHHAISQCDVEKLTALLADECAAEWLTERTKHGLTCIHLACVVSQASLPSSGVACITNGATATTQHQSAAASIVKLLCEAIKEEHKSTLIDAYSNNGFTALHLATYKADVSLMNTLLSQGASPNSKGGNHLPVMHVAAMNGSVELCVVLLDAGADVHSGDWVQLSPLHLAAYWAHDKVVRLLIDRGADVNAGGSVGDRPLHMSSSKGFMTIVKMLLDADADPTLADDEMNTALHFCARSGHSLMVEVLILAEKTYRSRHSEGEDSATAEVPLSSPRQGFAHQANMYGDTPLHAACYAGKLEVVKRLLHVSGTYSLTRENVFSETCLHAACSSGRNIDLVLYLLKQPGVDGNHQGQDGHTPLHSAAYHNHLHVVQLLCQHGADPTIAANPLTHAHMYTSSSASSSTASSSVWQQQHPLLQNTPSGSAPPTSSNGGGFSLGEEVLQTPIIWAYERGYDAVVALLKQYVNKRPDDVCSEYSSGDGSYTPLPSPLGRLRSITKEKAGILQLRSALPTSYHITLTDIELQEAVGAGSFGKVYRGIYQGKTVAIKRYRTTAFGSKSEVDMFCREVSILCKMDSPYVINFVGACLDDPSQFAIVTEYVRGGSLFYVLHEEKRTLDSLQRANCALTVARAMLYLHDLKQPVIHRDLNSHNILLADDRTMRAVVADFGESRFVRMPDDDNMTKQPGNLRWMAPEIFTQCKRYNTKADVFSYGLVLWELYTGDLPFAHLKPAAAAAEMAYKMSRPPLLPHFPPLIVELLQKAWHSDPELRPNFAEMLLILDDLWRSLEEAAPQMFDQLEHLDGDDALDNLSHVSSLRSQWEARATPSGSVNSTGSACTMVTTTSVVDGPDETTPPHNAAQRVSNSTVDELRRRLDRNGYVHSSGAQ